VAVVSAGRFAPPRALLLYAWLVPALLGVTALAAALAAVSGLLVVSHGKVLLFWMVAWGGLVEALLIIPMPQLGCYRLFVLIPFVEWLAKQIPGAGATSAQDWIILLHTASVMLRVREWPLPQSFNFPLLLFLLLNFFQGFNPNLNSWLIIYYGIRANVLPLLMFYVGFYVFRDEREMKRLLWWIAAIALLCCVWGWKQFFVGLDPMELQWAGGGPSQVTGDPTSYWNGPYLRVFGPFPGPWQFSEFLVNMIMMVTALFFAARALFARVVCVLLLSAYFFTIALIQVKAAYFALLTAVVILVFARLPRNLRFAWLGIVLGGLVAFYLSLLLLVGPEGSASSSFGKILVGFNPLASDEMQWRATNWDLYLNAIALAPLGWGVGMTTPVAVQARLVPASPLSQYITYLFELGWISIPLFIWMTAAAFGAGFRAARLAKSRFAVWFIPAMIGSHGALLIHYFFTPLAASPGTTYFWFLYGAACAYPFIRRDEPLPRGPITVPLLRPRPLLIEAPSERALPPATTTA